MLKFRATVDCFFRVKIFHIIKFRVKYFHILNGIQNYFDLKFLHRINFECAFNFFDCVEIKL